MSMHFIMVVATVFSLQTTHPKPVIGPTDTSPSLNTQVRWTWQLPRAVRNSFNNSSHANWYIQKMIRFESGNKTVYRLYLYNGNLLDGDHHDCFLQCVALDIDNNGTVLKN